MNGINLLVDTNILIYLLKAQPEIVEMLNGKNIFCSFISELELQSKKDLKIGETSLIKLLLEDCVVIDITKDIKKRVIELRKSTNLKLPDAIIAATAIEMALPLVTADVGFSKIKQIQLIQYKV